MGDYKTKSNGDILGQIATKSFWSRKKKKYIYSKTRQATFPVAKDRRDKMLNMQPNLGIVYNC